MSLEENNYYRDSQSLYNDCKRCVNYHVILTMTDGSKVDGIIEDSDSDSVNMLVGEDVMEQGYDSQSEYQRQPFVIGNPRRRFRRFRRRRIPFREIAVLSLLQYPYIMPPYPYYPYYVY